MYTESFSIKYRRQNPLTLVNDVVLKYQDAQSQKNIHNHTQYKKNVVLGYFHATLSSRMNGQLYFISSKKMPVSEEMLSR